MDHFAGLDVSVKETSLCVVDDAGRIVREVRVASEPEAPLAVLTNPACSRRRKLHCCRRGRSLQSRSRRTR
jgi:transposase